MKIPEPTNTTVAMIDKWHEDNQEPQRPHFGLSQAGHHCERYLWYSFRWVMKPDFSGRILRLFRRGHNEEYTVVSDLKNAGFKLTNVLEDQKRVIYKENKHVQGSCDGFIEGIPEAPKKLHLLEIKTMNQKGFETLKKIGLQKEKPIYYAQAQTYMLLNFPVDRCLHLTVNKNTDEIYTERVNLDKEYARTILERADRIVSSPSVPPGISEDPSWYQCKMCQYNTLCHSSIVPEINCRTCAHSTPVKDGTWHCERWDDTIPLEAQRTGCRAHVYHPELFPGEHKGGEGYTALYEVNGQGLKNGEDGYSSAEIKVIFESGITTDKSADNVRKAFDGEIVEAGKTLGEIQKEDDNNSFGGLF